ncbi:hypothetical protein, partial [Aeromonas hydrophila]|uniref:hypothetical protein n=1 Tax=Aeromonas hydrophila TaxID=644 RepID=UPI004039C279
MSAFVVPITKDGRLSAKEFIGNRTKMSNDQSSYADAPHQSKVLDGLGIAALVVAHLCAVADELLGAQPPI